MNDDKLKKSGLPASPELGEALDSVRAPFDADRAVEMAVGGNAVATARDGGLRLRERVSALMPSGRTLRWAVPTLATAGLAVLVWLGSRPEPSPLPAVVEWRARSGAGESVADALASSTDMRAAGTADTPPADEPVFSIDAPEAGQVAVFQTSNPKIRVVWFYDETESED